MMKKKLELKKEVVARLDQQSMHVLYGGNDLLPRETELCRTDLDCPTCCGNSCKDDVCEPVFALTCAHKTCPEPMTNLQAACVSIMTECLENPTLGISCGYYCGQ